MTTPKAKLAGLALIAALCAGFTLGLTAPAWAGLDEAVAAYKRADYATALRELRPLAEQGNAEAQTGLGFMYYYGQGVPKDYAEALKWSRKAADQGNAEAQFILGVMYRYGQGVPQDYAEAVGWWRKAAEQGHGKAQIRLAALYQSQGRYAEAGPLYQRALEHHTWEDRVGAARALGFIKYGPAVSALIKALSNNEDWRLVYVSVESLGRIGAEEAIGPLRHVAKSHWYPPVQIAAKTALEKIRTGAVYELREHFAFNGFKYEHPDYQPCSSTGFEVKQINEGDAKLFGEEHRSELAALTYTFQNSEKWLNSSGELERREYEVRWTPEVALRVRNGWLAGVDQGEFGGALLYVPGQGETEIVIDDNVQNIFRIKDDVVVITGLAHITLNYGMVYKVSKNAAGQWSAERWRTLPGAPQSSGLVDGERLLIHTRSGSILLSPDGDIEMATCAVPY